MPKNIECEGRLRVARPPAEAIELFTPEGERAWVPGWTPRYPTPDGADCRLGGVWLTGEAPAETIWVVVERSEDARSYARVVPGAQAGLVCVRCRADGDGTLVTVMYRMTALSEQAEADLAGFADGFADYLAGWERRIAELS